VECSVSAFRLLAAAWNGVQEVVAEVDPATGVGTQLGALGNLTAWSGQIVHDEVTGTVYALGLDGDGIGDWNVYSFEVDTGGSSQVRSSIQGFLATAGVDAAGQLVVVWWDDAVKRHRVGLMNPRTGSISARGNMGNFSSWSAQTGYDRLNHIVYAVGATGDTLGDWRLYSFDLDTNRGASVPARPWVLAGVGLNGHPVATYSDNFEGSRHTVFDVNPSNGVATSLGQLGDLHSWYGQNVLDARAGRVYAAGMNEIVDELGNAQRKLYTLDLKTGAASAAPFASSAPYWIFAKQ
jgi:hypothetical protein